MYICIRNIKTAFLLQCIKIFSSCMFNAKRSRSIRLWRKKSKLKKRGCEMHKLSLSLSRLLLSDVLKSVYLKKRNLIYSRASKEKTSIFLQSGK